MILFPNDRVDVYEPVAGGVDRFGNQSGNISWNLVASNVKCDIQPLDHLDDGDHMRKPGINDEAVYIVFMYQRPYVGNRYKLVVTRYGRDASGEGLVGKALGVIDRDYYSKIMPHQRLTCSPNRVI